MRERDVQTTMFAFCNGKMIGKLHLWELSWISDIRLLKMIHWFTEVECAVYQAVCGSLFVGTLGAFKSSTVPLIPFIYILSLQASTATQFAHREPFQQAACNLRSLRLLSWGAGQSWFWLNFHTLKTRWLYLDRTCRYYLVYIVLRGRLWR